MKKIKFLLVAILLMSVFGTNQVLAADDYPKVDLSGSWTAGVDLVKGYTEFDGESAASSGFKNMKGPIEFLFVEVAGKDAIENGDSLIQYNTIPEHMKIGLAGVVDNGVTAMFNNHPRIDVVAHLSKEWVPGYKESASSVYANGFEDLQGTGIDEIWSFSRNLAYLGFVIIMIVIGFMIMFRNKIGGQALVTLGNTLPRIVVSLVLVTFSFAIIGLIIDISGVMMNVITNLIGGTVSIHRPFELLKGTLGSTGTAVTSGLSIGGIAMFIIGSLASGGPAFAVGATVVLGLIGFLIGLLVFGIVIVGAIKLWLSLLKSYLGVLVNVIAAPFAILMGALPGNDASIINIFKSALRNAMVFPVAYAIVNLPYFLEPKQVNFGFPETLTGEVAGKDIGGFILAVAKVMAIYVAAQTPSFMKAIIPATASKSGADASALIKDGFSKVPLIGGMFK
jgi:hypothetical protein